jgi:hypothetical protein
MEAGMFPSANRVMPVVKGARLVAMAVALGLVGLGVTGCGGSGGVVAEVAGKTITKASFDHWMAVTAIRDYEPVPRGPVSSGVLPDPPRYAACIAHLQASAPHTVGATPPSREQLKKQCQQGYRALREQVLSSLITGWWLIAEGEARGLKASASEVKRRAKQIEKTEFANNAELRRYLKDTKETVADRLFRAKIKVFSKKIEDQITASTHEGRNAVTRFVLGFPREWAAKTTCRPGYVMYNCREYKGPIPPEARLL